ncbi:superoxide dismutase [Colletotrichum godetiae]|uniref:Superoxide dismutase n=1 Tax=Colletotrichum godetiae TaxID=1209918 RepID=A0AAJ0A6F0_9PEZI|nr:superoxide dismutase [Colletotrichum godetiae]XP_060422133.1 superoxide dismutase [Colletotrichum godetiae]KAK1656758.1 superoxide dismutase [Colletotrichum godetiae]KAK1657369.1 superoxide dismutase [Colletotrichum godetiae]
MRSSFVFPSPLQLFASAALRGTGELGDAPFVKNPQGIVYEAILPDRPFFEAGSMTGNVRGIITAMTARDGNGVELTVGFSNLPTEGGPFTYHLHADPIPEDGNCTKALAHHDPFIRGEGTPCDASKPETCQVGDLSGSFFGNRSFVLHFANKTRITCTNFKLVESAPPYNNGTGIPSAVQATGAAPIATSHDHVPFVGAASTLSVSVFFLCLTCTAAYLVRRVGDI